MLVYAARCASLHATVCYYMLRYAAICYYMLLFSSYAPTYAHTLRVQAFPRGCFFADMLLYAAYATTYANVC